MLKAIINWGELKVPLHQKEEFFKALRGLISIFFAVVIGFGFQQFVAPKPPPFLSHFVALVVICLSWWGYFWGITCGPKELNVLNVIIDALLLVLYWILLNFHEHHQYLYPLMFLLYILWEVVRWLVAQDPAERETLNRALRCNVIFFFIISAIYVVEDFLALEFTINTAIATPILTLVTVVIYRHFIQKAYLEKNQRVHRSLYIKNAKLIDEAKRIARKAYTPLSNYKVGAAIIDKNDNIYTGCNVEFMNYSNTIHAEEAALSSMVSAGGELPKRIAVYTQGDEPAFPCGMCLQSLFELGGKDLIVIACNDHTEIRKGITDLLPFGFSL